MNTVFLSLGTNIGDRSNFLHQAKELIHQRIGNITEQSSVYETEPWGFFTELLFLNQVVKVETNLLPYHLLQKIQSIEKEFGRIRSTSGFESRTMDIDILFYDNLVVNSPGLTIPHPRLHLRNFTMIPLGEIASTLVHPVFEQRIVVLAQACPDTKSITVYPQYSAIIREEDEV
jgi:2-amino-4-hydroxy-6-hydroxymethyldihydropteridine diphosphokinase